MTEKILTFPRNLIVGPMGQEYWRGFAAMHDAWYPYKENIDMSTNSFVSNEAGRQKTAILYQTIRAEQGFWTDRSAAEKDTKLIQPITYCLIRKPERDDRKPSQHDKYFVYKRCKTTTEQRLSQRASIGVGGHINPEDRVSRRDIIRIAGQREVREEFDVPEEYIESIYPIGLLRCGYGEAEDVNTYHLGVVLIVDVPQDLEIHSREDKNVPVKWVEAIDIANYLCPMAQAMENCINCEVETWTEILAKAIHLTVLNNHFKDR